MIKWIGYKLAKCFDAHLSDEEQKLKIKIDRVRTAAQEFNKALEDLPSSASGYVNFFQWGDKKWVTLKSFRLGKIECFTGHQNEL